MLPISLSLGKYTPVKTTDDPNSEFEKDPENLCSHYSCAVRCSIKSVSVSFAIVTLLIVGLLAFFDFHSRPLRIQASVSCKNPIVRHEWRTLSRTHQEDYINAALCLRELPSRLHPGMALYEDFPFLHDAVGDYAHETAAFLTWHRYFIHLYETILREDCGYEGSVPYWDWSLDSSNLSESPVFKSPLGFGGDSPFHGNASENAIVGGNRCVEDGPWAGMLVHWWTQSAPPHCLSRGFQDVKPINEMGSYLTSEKLAQLQEQPDYESFFLMMEHGVHNALQVAIGGDIMFNAAPYDPLFYLHHSQLDRLWWRWQLAQPSRQTQYLGLASSFSNDAASLDDLIPMGDFAPAIAAKELMNTESGILCYRY